MPGRRERPRALVVRLGGIEREVEPVRLVDQLAVRQRRCASFDAERGELLVERREHARVLVAIRVPARPVADGVARERRRERGILQLERVARDDSRPRPTRGEDRREADDVVLHDHVGLNLVEDLPQPVVDVPRAVAEGAERRLDELGQLVERRLPEHGGRLADEVLPELPGLLVRVGWRPEAHQALLESLRLEAARERLLDDEHHAVAALDEHLADPDAVVRRAVRPLGEEYDRRLALSHVRSRPSQ
jgi:hypothetical protein